MRRRDRARSRPSPGRRARAWARARARTGARRSRRAARRAARRRRASCRIRSATSRARRGRRARPGGRAPGFGTERGCRAPRALCDARRHAQLEERLHIRIRLLRVRSRSACLDRLCHHRGNRRRTNLTGRHHAVRSNKVAAARHVRRVPHDLVRPWRARAGVPRRRPARRLRARRRSSATRRCSPTAPAAATAPLREWLGDRHGVEPGRVVVTNGGLQGFVFYAEELLAERPGRVLVEAPTYDRPLKLLARLGRRGRGAADGRRRARPGRARARARRAARRASSTRSRPSRTRAAARSRRSAAGASSSSRRRTESPCSRTTRTGSSATRARRRRRCFELEGGELVTYASSFSKTVAPGVRVGWFVAPAELAARIEARAVSTYISPPFLTQATVHELIARGAFEPNLERDPRPAAARRDAMLGALERELGGDGDVERARGRLLRLGRPPGRRGRAARSAPRRQASPSSRARTSSRTAAASASARLAFSYASPSEIDSGVSTLASLLRV